MSQLLVLGERALREAKRTPDALLPTLLIPLFFLVVNVGQAARIFPTGSTPSLEGQSYAAFQVPSALLLAMTGAAESTGFVRYLRSGSRCRAWIVLLTTYCGTGSPAHAPPIHGAARLSSPSRTSSARPLE